jgi:hypothetical protein
MTQDDLFTAYYTQYRSEATIPESTDDEYTIFTRLANEAINRWANYDNTYWKELFTTLSLADESTTITTGVTDYDTPSNFREGGGYVRVLNTDGALVDTYGVIEPHEVQFQGDQSSYAYFFGNPSEGYTPRLNPAPTSSVNGYTIDYDYYKTPTLFVNTTDTTEMSQPYFIVHRSLWSRFRGSRNPFSDEAKVDAEDVLKTMQIENNSGNWANPWVVPDNSGAVWGT